MNYFEVLFWPGGGVIGLVLWLMSIATIAIIVQYFIAIRRDNIVPDLIHQKIRELLEIHQYGRAIDLTSTEPSFLSYVVHASLKEAVGGYNAMGRAMAEAAEERTTKLLRHIEWLNLIGNISPMLGLLGTVWGMIQAFFAIVQAGGIPDPANLAGAIGIALVTTLLGLAVAIPALAVYGVMRNRIDVLTSEAILVGQELISILRDSKKA